MVAKGKCAKWPEWKADMIAKGLYLIESFSFYNYTRSSYSKTRNYARWFEGSTTTTDEVFHPV